MNRQELADVVLGITQTLNDSDQVSPVFLDTNFRRDLGFDDLDCLHLHLLIEDKLDVSIPDEDWRDIEAVAHIIDWLIQNQPYCPHCDCYPCRCDEVAAVTEAVERQGVVIH